MFGWMIALGHNTAPPHHTERKASAVSFIGICYYHIKPLISVFFIPVLKKGNSVYLFRVPNTLYWQQGKHIT